jgi:hypothetical protein
MAGIESRRHSPLLMGEYKLQEASRHLKSFREEMELMRGLKSNQEEFYGLRHSISEDCYKWAEKIPMVVAHYLGYFVLPAISALSGDGVSAESINAIKKKHRCTIKELIESADQIFQRFHLKKCGINYPWTTYGQEAQGLLKELIQVIDCILLDIKNPQSGSLCIGAAANKNHPPQSGPYKVGERTQSNNHATT